MFRDVDCDAASDSAGLVVYNQREKHITVNRLLSCVITMEICCFILATSDPEVIVPIFLY